MGEAKSVLRLLAALAGLFALWLGCDLTNTPLLLGGPMNLALNPLGVPLLAFGLVGVALTPARGWVVVWPLAAVLAFATAGVNIWRHVPFEDGAFQSLQAGVPDPDTWPAPAFLHALALALVGVALAALLPGPQRAAPLLLASAMGAVGSGLLLLEAFSDAMLGTGPSATLVAIGVPAAALLALTRARAARPALRGLAGQGGVLLGLCIFLWLQWRSVG
ncbi:hypothetical protein EAH89_13040 [Roseomonas nepalensis]|uniref:Uncharacterized protein n=2 Tax=Muricoccus nepalensis TaxID=1854500 RepID=A0A502G285_9PROT|nr:hypothetical protein EAH89_13040 [Roseomonas nepalensis]